MRRTHPAQVPKVEQHHAVTTGVDCPGAMEKRLLISMVVNITSAQVRHAEGTELTYTLNVSAHGACVVSDHAWQPGEVAEVTSMLDQMPMYGKVVYCLKEADNRYVIGLSFQKSDAVWSMYFLMVCPPNPEGSVYDLAEREERYGEGEARRTGDDRGTEAAGGGANGDRRGSRNRSEDAPSTPGR